MNKISRNTATSVMNVDQDAVVIGNLISEAKASIVTSVVHAIEAGKRLSDKKESVGHGNWLAWLEENAETLGFASRFTAAKLIRLASNVPSTAHLDETEALSLSKQLWGNEPADGGNGPVHRVSYSGDNEWFTPPEYIELARETMGAIDLDPATHEVAQRDVKATRWFTEQDNGLVQEWQGRVWLNPPYAQPVMTQFIDKLIAEYQAERTSEAVLLTHNSTDTAWFHKAASACAAICFTRGRIRFRALRDSELLAPPQGQAFFYFGKDAERFISVFAHAGFVCLECGSYAYECV